MATTQKAKIAIKSTKLFRKQEVTALYIWNEYLALLNFRIHSEN